MVQVGSTVLYTLSSDDANAVNIRRADAFAYRQMHWRTNPGAEGATGFVAHVGNNAVEGDMFPALVVRDWGASVNLQVFLDGNDTFWACSRSEGQRPGEWIEKA